MAANPPPPNAQANLDALREAVIPSRDRYDLAARFLGIEDARVTPPGEFEVGDRTTFWVDNDEANQTYEVEAELVYRTDVVYMFVEVGQDYDYDDIVRSADRFTEETYPTNRANFGSEPNPGIDGDPRLFILHTDKMGFGVAGYFFSPSEFPASIVPYSNEKEIFFINISNTPPGTDYYDSVLAHEFQHMIHYNVDSNEESWMNEGLSEVASYLNGFGPSSFAPFYLFDTDIQLTDWPEEGDTSPHYGAGFLFNTYFHDRFGAEALRDLISHTENGLDSVDAVLDDLGLGLTADDVFADWAIALWLNDQGVAPQYGYHDIRLGPPAVAGTITSYPARGEGQQVRQYGIDYILLEGVTNVNIHFEGSTLVGILPTDTANTDGDPATDDQFVWWSNRGDDSDMTLTRTVDLTGVASASLEYDVWYWLEEGWDYGYVEVSTDGGRTWTLLETPHTTEDNPHGNSYGAGYSGQSSLRPGANPNGWLHESLDLSAYAGQAIQIRFETLTDDAVNQPGMAVDNICIRAIGLCDDVESGADGWEARGFVRHTNLLPQTFIVQVIVPDDNGHVDVLRMPLDELNRGDLQVEASGSQPVVLVISGSTRYTTQPGVYRYEITPLSE